MTPYIYLILSSACSILLVHLLKIGEIRGLRMLNTLTVNYLVAAIFAFTAGDFTSAVSNLASPGLLFGFCTVVGAVFIFNFVLYSKSIHLNGMGISVTSMRLSLFVPVFVSVAMYQEILTVTKSAGLVLVIAAIILMFPRKRGIKIKNINAAWLLLAIFILTGFADASLKIYQEDFSRSIDELGFMVLVFGAAFIIGSLISFFRKGPVVTGKEFILGALIGIPNLYSSVFLIYALKGMDGAVAYPVVNILNVAGGTLVGLWYWKDRVTMWQWGGIAVALGAIILLF